VMSSHGYSGLARWLLGSVAEKVLRGADCPVLVVRSIMPITRILITLDGSPLSAHVLEPAMQIARRTLADVTLLRALPPLDPYELQAMDAHEAGLGQRLREELRDQAQTYLWSAAEPYARQGMTIHTVVEYGEAAQTIMDYAERAEIDLIAMATHGRTGLRRWRYGSVTEKVLRATGRSMLVVRPPDAELSGEAHRGL
jgi:nucleotide-binding universal stress UspA family protein